jgi:hypothetical protein
MIPLVVPMRILIGAMAIGLMPVALIPTLASADQAGSAYTPITRLNLTRAPSDACMDTCSDIARQERDRLGPEPASPLFRMSATQATTGRASFVQRLAQQSNLPKDLVESLVPKWDGAIREWRGEDPKGDFKPNDLADILAKYWLFAWMYGAGFDPEKLTEAQRTAVRIQVHRLFVTDPVLALLTEGQRQGLADTLIRGQYADMLALSTAGQDIGPTMDAIAAHFQSLFDLDLQNLGLTADQGFVLRSAP